MKAHTNAVRSRRPRVPRDRYRATARTAGVRARMRRPLIAFHAVILVIAAGFVIFTGPLVGSALDSAGRQLGESVGNVFPALEGGGKKLDLPTTGGNVGAEPVVQGLPDFTRDAQLQIAGRVPSFAVVPGRTVEIVVNGSVIGTVPLDQSGAFGSPAVLKDGANVVGVTLFSGTDVVARSSYTVVLDRTPPSLALTRPTNNATIDGPNVVVEGRAEVGATVSVNGQNVVPGPDGTFSTTFTASPGPLPITVVARDRAGNETTAKSSVTLRAQTTFAPAAVVVTLDRSKVRPGEAVTALILVTENGQPKSNVQVTLSVGVITIGTAFTDSSGVARIGFAAPPNEGDASVVVLAAGAAGRAPLTVAR